MSKYTTYYYSKQDQYKTFASSWVRFTADMNLTDRQRRGMALFFKPIAKRFGLVQYFKTIGVL